MASDARRSFSVCHTRRCDVAKFLYRQESKALTSRISMSRTCESDSLTLIWGLMEGTPWRHFFRSRHQENRARQSYVDFIRWLPLRIFSDDPCSWWCIARERGVLDDSIERGLVPHGFRMFGVPVERSHLARSRVFRLSVSLYEKSRVF